MGQTAIGIGGSGARCIEALVFLCAAGLGPIGDELFAFFIDQDAGNGNVDRAQATLRSYIKCRKLLGKPSADRGFFSTNITIPKGTADDPLIWEPFSQKTLGDYLDFTSLSEDNNQHLVRLLINSEDHLKMPLEEGFRGVPMIGTFGMMNIDAQRNPFRRMIEGLQSQMPGRVFVFASIFGGAGAAGFPSIGEFYKEKIATTMENARLGGALLLPYFGLHPKPDEKKAEFAAEYYKFHTNSRAALKYYANPYNWKCENFGTFGNPYSWIYVLGDPSPKLTSNTFETGTKKQMNRSHYIELIAAAAAREFFETEEIHAPADGLPGSERYAVREYTERAYWEDMPLERKFDMKRRMLYMLAFSHVFRNYFMGRDGLLTNPLFDSRPYNNAWYAHNFRHHELSLNKAGGRLEPAVGFL